MNYRLDKYGNRLSILGYGCMRFTSKAGKPDIDKAERELLEAYRLGVNYFDTAYIYPGSEALLGEVLERNNIRDKVYIATKLPHYLVKTRDDMDRIFNEELKRLRTDHVDYYLIHMLTDLPAWERIKALGIEEWIEEKKRSGQIRQIGFSYHGNSNMFCEIIDSYDWDFCLIQYNYMDENSQAGRRGLNYAHGKGIPVFIMEPLRGGRLVKNLPDEALRLFENHNVKHTPAGWALRWLWNQPEVTVVLSGMNSLEMVRDNVETASSVEAGELTESDEAMLKSVVKAINSKIKVGCTGCGYCVPCPKNVDIPGIFSAYNRRFSEGWFASMKDYFMCTALRKDSTSASNCIGCGKCKKHCPQGIDIPREMKEVEKKMEGVIFKTARSLAKRFVKF
ncbi:MAG: aldo/keto reductase [Clostridia bacterium]|nr:aldo/keto reductase [Clostridia bacterium]